MWCSWSCEVDVDDVGGVCDVDEVDADGVGDEDVDDVSDVIKRWIWQQFFGKSAFGKKQLHNSRPVWLRVFAGPAETQATFSRMSEP